MALAAGRSKVRIGMNLTQQFACVPQFFFMGSAVCEAQTQAAGLMEGTKQDKHLFLLSHIECDA
jgi:hypothetical protein